MKPPWNLIPPRMATHAHAHAHTHVRGVVASPHRAFPRCWSFGKSRWRPEGGRGWRAVVEGQREKKRAPLRGDGLARKAAAAADAPRVAPEDDEVADLLAWAASDALRLSPKVTVGPTPSGASRGLVVTADAAGGGVKEGEEVIFLPSSCTAFDADAAREDVDTGLSAAIAAYESDPTRGGDVTPEIALSLFTVLAARHPERSTFGAYVRALPRQPPATPLMFSDATLQALLRVLPLSLIDAIDAARQDLYQLWDVAAAVMDRVGVVGGGDDDDAKNTAGDDGAADAAGKTPFSPPPDPPTTTATTAEAPLELDEFFWAWMMIRSRAITFRVKRGSDGAVEAKRCMVPVVDFMVWLRPGPRSSCFLFSRF